MPTTIKLIVWDLDNTLWNGVLSEGDATEVNPEAVAAIKELDQRGVLHSIASKNETAVTKEKLVELGLWEYFLHPQIHWGPKSDSIRHIKEAINIGYDAIAFIDDQPFERDEVNHTHTEVQTFDTDIIPQLLEDKRFEPPFVTPESAKRRLLYQLDHQRTLAESEFKNPQSFLESLQLQMTIRRGEEGDLQRMEELTVRTNQLNATGYTYSYDELKELLQSDQHRLYVAELTDRYGTYGKIGLTMLEETAQGWTIKLLLVSCRVMSRGAGSGLLGTIIRQARQEGKSLFAEFKPTDRNRIMYITYKFAGFTEAGTFGEGGVILQHTQLVDSNTDTYLTIDFRP